MAKPTKTRDELTAEIRRLLAMTPGAASISPKVYPEPRATSESANWNASYVDWGGSGNAVVPHLVARLLSAWTEAVGEVRSRFDLAE